MIVSGPKIGLWYFSYECALWMCSICFLKKYGWSIFVWKKQKHKKIIACYFDELQLIFKRLFFFVKHEHESMSWRAFLVIPFQFIFISYNKLLSYRQGHSQTYNIWLKKKKLSCFFVICFCKLIVDNFMCYNILSFLVMSGPGLGQSDPIKA